MEDKEVFSFDYSAQQQEEIRRIREKYAPPAMDKMERLRELDRSVYRKGTVVSLIFGIIGTLIMGVGMTCTMVWQGVWFIPGIVLGLAGIVVLALAYPIYEKVTQKERERVAPEILRLTDELMK